MSLTKVLYNPPLRRIGWKLDRHIVEVLYVRSICTGDICIAAEKAYSEDIAVVPLQGARSFPLVLPACSSLTVYRQRLSISIFPVSLVKGGTTRAIWVLEASVRCEGVEDYLFQGFPFACNNCPSQDGS